MRSVIVGASAGLGRALADLLAGEGHTLFLVASDARDLEATAADVALRRNAAVHTLAIDLADFDAADLRARALAALGGIDCLFLIAGRSGELSAGPVDDTQVAALATVNFTAPMRIANAFASDLRRGAGAIVGAGTVASIRARRRNAPYAAAKTGLEFYFRALRHDFARDSRCRVQFYRLGYLGTRMTFGQKLPLPALDPRRAARAIVAGLRRDFEVAYLPGWWRFVAIVLNAIPRRVFDRLDI